MPPNATSNTRSAKYAKAWRDRQKATVASAKIFREKEAVRKKRERSVENAPVKAQAREALQATKRLQEENRKTIKEVLTHIVKLTNTTPDAATTARLMAEVQKPVQDGRFEAVAAEISGIKDCESLADFLLGAMIAEAQAGKEAAQTASGATGSRKTFELADFDVESARKGKYRLAKESDTKKVLGVEIGKDSPVVTARKNIQGNIDKIEQVYEQYQTHEKRIPTSDSRYKRFDCKEVDFKLLQTDWKEMFVFVTSNKFRKKVITKKDSTHNYAPSTVKGYPIAINSIIGKIKSLQTMHKEAIPFVTLFARLYDRYKEQQELTPNELANFIQWDNFLSLESHIKMKYGPTSKELAVYNLYAKIPPRRSKDYRLLKFTKIDPKSFQGKKITQLLNSFHKGFNHYVTNNQGTLLVLVFNQYKTSGTYGQQVFYTAAGLKQIGIKEANAFTFKSDYTAKGIHRLEELGTALAPYVDTLKNGDYFFPSSKSDKKDMGSSAFASFLPSIISGLKSPIAKGRRFGSTLARHSFIQKVRVRGELTEAGQKAVSKGDLEKIATFMGHDGTMQVSYDRIVGEKGKDQEDEEVDRVSLPWKDKNGKYIKGSGKNDTSNWKNNDSETWDVSVEDKEIAKPWVVYKEVVDKLQGKTQLDPSQEVLGAPDPAPASPMPDASKEDGGDDEEEDDEGDDESYTVEKILERKKENGRVMFKVKWQGYTETSWEPRTSLIKSAKETVTEFEKAQKKK